MYQKFSKFLAHAPRKSLPRPRPQTSASAKGQRSPAGSLLFRQECRCGQFRASSYNAVAGRLATALIFYCEKDSGDHHGSSEKWIYYITAYPNPYIVAELYSFNVTPNIFLSLINTDSSYYIDTLHAACSETTACFHFPVRIILFTSSIHTSLIHCHDHHLKPCHDGPSHTVQYYTVVYQC